MHTRSFHRCVNRPFKPFMTLQGHACCSLQFGAWAGAGMAGGALASKLEHSGLLLVTPPLGLTALGGWLIYLPFCLVPSFEMSLYWRLPGLLILSIIAPSINTSMLSHKGPDAAGVSRDITFLWCRHGPWQLCAVVLWSSCQSGCQRLQLGTCGEASPASVALLPGRALR